MRLKNGLMLHFEIFILISVYVSCIRISKITISWPKIVQIKKNNNMFLREYILDI